MHNQFPVHLAAGVRYSNFLVILLFLGAWGFAQKAEPVDAFVEKKMQEMHIPGLSLAVVKNGKVIKAAGYGRANVETGTARYSRDYVQDGLTEQANDCGCHHAAGAGERNYS